MLRRPAAQIFSEGAGPKPSLPAPLESEGGEAPKVAGAERRTPWPALRSGRSLQRKGSPANDARRRAFRRFTAAFFSLRVDPRPGHWRQRRSAIGSRPGHSARRSVWRCPLLRRCWGEEQTSLGHRKTDANDPRADLAASPHALIPPTRRWPRSGRPTSRSRCERTRRDTQAICARVRRGSHRDLTGVRVRTAYSSHRAKRD